MKYADMHCDTLMEAYFAGRKSLLSVPEAMTDIGRLCQGECMMQFFAIFLPCADIWEWYGRTPVPDEEYLEGCRQIYVNTLSENGDLTTGAGTYEDIRCNEKEGRMTAVLTLEDGRCVQGSMERLEHLYRDMERAQLFWRAQQPGRQDYVGRSDTFWTGGGEIYELPGHGGGCIPSVGRGIL